MSKHGRVIAFAIGLTPFWFLMNSVSAIDPPKPPIGTWAIVKQSFNGKPTAEAEGGIFTLAEGNAGRWIVNKYSRQKNGQQLLIPHDDKVNFVFNAANKNVEYFEFEMANRGDALAEGGGGPRKGIGRYNKDGTLEMIYNTSADLPYPSDFSDATKQTTIYWLMKPTEAKPAEVKPQAK